MQTHAKQKIDADRGHEDKKEGARARGGQAESGEPADEPAVEDGDITQESDQGPNLFRVPAPKTSPGKIGPYAPQDGPGRQQHHAHLQRAIEEEIQATDL